MIIKNDLSKRHQIKLIARWVSWAIFFISTGIIILIQRGWGNAGTFLGLIGAGLALSTPRNIAVYYRLDVYYFQSHL